MTLKETISDEIPAVERIESEPLRENTLEAVATAVEESEYERPSDLPGLTRLADRIEVDNAQHTNGVAELSRDIGTRFDSRMGMTMDLDTITAGAVCHDIGKYLEYTKGPDGWRRTAPELRHPFSGAAICWSVGLPIAVVHIVATHSREGDRIERSAEASVVHHADFLYWRVIENRHPHLE